MSGIKSAFLVGPSIIMTVSEYSSRWGTCRATFQLAKISALPSVSGWMRILLSLINWSGALLLRITHARHCVSVFLGAHGFFSQIHQAAVWPMCAWVRKIPPSVWRGYACCMKWCCSGRSGVASNKKNRLVSVSATPRATTGTAFSPHRFSQHFFLQFIWGTPASCAMPKTVSVTSWACTKNIEPQSKKGSNVLIQWVFLRGR